mmetsp:Transcript_2802/g.2627  ORF Transcript_2802/g.2627 Transcript_2802/m.2627 type:complete len:93 (-) Transcript_2802:307-585(-)
MLLPIFNLLKELLAHVLHIHIESFIGQGLQAHVLSPFVFFLAFILYPFLGLSHHSLVDSTLLWVYQRLIRLLQQVEGINGLFVLVLVRMDQH